MNDNAIEKAKILRSIISDLTNTIEVLSEIPNMERMIERRKGQISFLTALEAEKTEKPGEDAESLLSMMFRDIREVGYLENPLRLTEVSHKICVSLINHFFDACHAQECAKCKRSCENCKYYDWALELCGNNEWDKNPEPDCTPENKYAHWKPLPEPLMSKSECRRTEIQTATRHEKHYPHMTDVNDHPTGADSFTASVDWSEMPDAENQGACK
jgi:hypothetical protein